MSHPPHLPPKEEKIGRNIREFLLFVGIVVVLSFASAMAAASVVFTWFLPPFPASRSVFTFFQNKENSGESVVLTGEQENEVKERTVKIFDTRKKLSGEFFERSGFLGEATLLTLDGWSVFLGTAVSPADIPYLQVVDNQGRILSVEKLVNETTSGLTYIDVQGEGFPVFPMVNSDSPLNNFSWLFKEGEFIPTQIAVTLPLGKEGVQPLTQLITRVGRGSTPLGFVVNAKAELSGFVDKSGVFIPSTEITRHLRSLQKSGTIVTKGVPVVGYIAERVQKNEQGTTQVEYGFVVTDAGKIKTGILNGDIIVRIQEKNLQPKTMREDIFSAPDEMTISVLRQGKIVEVKVKKV